MTTTGTPGTPSVGGSRRFMGVANVEAGLHPVALARIVTTGPAGKIDRREVTLARGVLVAALEALCEQDLVATILVTPAGFIDHKPRGEWSGTAGWQTTQADFDRLAAVAEGVTRRSRDG